MFTKYYSIDTCMMKRPEQFAVKLPTAAAARLRRDVAPGGRLHVHRIRSPSQAIKEALELLYERELGESLLYKIDPKA